MTVTPITPLPPSPPLNNITPFTYRDGWSFLELIENLREWINDTVVVGVNANFDALVEMYLQNLEQIIADNDATVAQILANQAAFEDNIQAIIDSINAGNGMDILVGVFGATGDGVTDDTAAIQAAFAAAPNGSVVRFGNGTYRVTDTIANIGAGGVRKSVSVDAFGATILIDHNLPVIQFIGGYEQAYAVTNVEPVLDNEASVSGRIVYGNELTLVVDVPDEWKRGDILRLVANDIIPGSRDAGTPGTLTQGRVGQFVTHVSDTGNFCITAGKLDDPFTSFVRVARMRNDVRCEWRGGRFIYSDTAFVGTPNYIFTFEELVSPRILDVTIDRTSRGAFYLRECYNWIVRGCKINFGTNDLTQLAYGYGLLNIGSALGVMSECSIGQVRHGYTDGHGMILATSTADAPVSDHGRPYSNRVIGCVVTDSTGSGFDTHTSGLRQQFIGCEVNNAVNGVTLRGLNNIVDGFLATNVEKAIAIFDEGTGGTSEGHVLNNLTVNNAVNVVTVEVGIRDGLYQFQRHLNPIIIRNVHARNIQSRPGIFYYSTIHLSQWTIESVDSPEPATDLAGFWSEGSYCYVDNIHLDTNSKSAALGESFWFQSVGDAGFPQLLDAQNIHLMGNTDVIIAPVTSSGPTYNIARAQIFAEQALTERSQIPTSAGSFVEWFLKGLSNKGLRARATRTASIAVNDTSASVTNVASVTFTAEPGADYLITAQVEPGRSGAASGPMRAAVNRSGSGIGLPALVFDATIPTRDSQAFSDIWSVGTINGPVTLTLEAWLDTAQTGVWSVNTARLTVERV